MGYRRKRMLLAGWLVVSVAIPGHASAFFGDFFDPDASGNAVYEAMAISPEALYDPVADATYVAYQGFGLDPYVAAYSHATGRWNPPVRVGDNPLLTNAHGGPSLVVDASGYLHVFYGAHWTALRHAVSARPHDASEWLDAGSVRAGGSTRPIALTYPQPLLGADGSLVLYYRSFDRDWQSIVSTDSGVTWSTPETVLSAWKGESADGKPVDIRWYADFEPGPDGRVHAAFIRHDQHLVQPFERRDLYYKWLDPAGGVWRNIAGTPLVATGTPDYLRENCLAASSGTRTVNQAVVRDRGDGVPVMLHLSQSAADPGVFEWQPVRWSGAATGSPGATWTVGPPIAVTDHFFDAADLQVQAPGELRACLTVGGFPDEQVAPGDPYASRGGDVAEWTSTDGGASWSFAGIVRSSPDASARYNNPQYVMGGHPDARLLFCEWNNDVANFIHKVFVHGSSGFLQREFTTDVSRVAGQSRYGTAVEASRLGYPNGLQSDSVDKHRTVIIASGRDYPDALCGVPLAHALNAPVLMAQARSLDASTAAEISRLRATRAIVLGGPSAVSTAVAEQVRAALWGSKTVERIGGGNRYETSLMVARRLSTRRGAPTTVAVASGENFADALAVSPLAARRGWPVILTRSARMTSDTVSGIRSLGASSALIAGGPAAVCPTVADSVSAAVGSVERIGGEDRYETASMLSARYLAVGTARTDRLLIASGQGFPDALVGGTLAARMQGTLLLTRGDSVPDHTARFIDERTRGVVHVYILGSAQAIAPEVENDIATHLVRPY